MAKILVVGSANMDVTYSVPHVLAPGETIIATGRSVSPGGKGANQAVAAARLGGDVAFLGRVGADGYGDALKKSLADAGVDVSNIITDVEHPTGTAIICVGEDDGQNTIVVDPGANAAMSAEDIWDHAACFSAADYIVIQLEIGFSAVQAAITMGKMLDKRVILNPAPAKPMEPELLNGIYCLAPNETEAEMLFGDFTNDQLPNICNSFGIRNTVVTLGGKGALLVQNGMAVRMPTMRVKAVDTTGAGDCFVGAMTVALSEGKDLPDAIEFANQAAAISVTRKGAQTAMPFRDEIDED